MKPKRSSKFTYYKYPLHIRHCAKRPKLIALVGPSASGKTSLANNLVEKLGRNNTAIISQDQYYKDWSRLPLKKREKINFDHPNSFDFRLLKRNLRDLKQGLRVKIPIYSYKRHLRLTKQYTLIPKHYVIVEGLVVLYKKSLRDLFNIKIYLDIDKAKSLARRINRDVEHRGEIIDSICKRYFEDVLPMQKKYVELQKQYADIVVNGCNADNRGLLNRLTQALKRR